MDEVGNPTILATFAVIAAILPMAFVGGLMGPYMRPIPVGATVAMLFSLFIAFIVSPWAATRLLRGARGRGPGPRGGRRGLDHPALPPDHDAAAHRLEAPVALPGVVVLLLVGSGSLVYFKLVTVKMLPFDNKSELQVIVDMPDGTTLEETARVGRELGQALSADRDVTDLQLYVGTAAPYNFNGLVRHYFPRCGRDRTWPTSR